MKKGEIDNYNMKRNTKKKTKNYRNEGKEPLILPIKIMQYFKNNRNYNKTLMYQLINFVKSTKEMEELSENIES